MFAKLTLVALATFAVLAGAAPTDGGSSPTGSAQCCQNVENSNKVDSVTAGLIKELLGVDVSALNVPIGTGCTPIAVLGGVSW
jgi:hypothetical protein